MKNNHTARIAEELKLRTQQVHQTLQLLADGATVPFIARYRKEATGGLDEVEAITIRDRFDQLQELQKRRESILTSLTEGHHLTEELKAKVLAAETVAALLDIYLPYRPKRRTRALIAKEKGLEPLAKVIFGQRNVEPFMEAEKFINPDKGIEQVDDALAGARDIIAEWVNEDAVARGKLRKLFVRKAMLTSKVIKGKEIEGIKYKDYYDWEEPLAKAPSHRILAILRGANEGILNFHILPADQEALAILDRQFIKADSSATQQVRLAIQDGYKRLIAPSLETEMRQDAKKRADEAAIQVFAENLRNLLLAPPFGQKFVLAIDPGLRTGCKVVCLDASGQLLHTDTIYPLAPHNRTEESALKLKTLIDQHNVEVVAIGNGTGGREAQAFCKGIDFGRKVSVVLVNESGASVYSASEAGREEFPDYDITVRGTVSIGRRLMDPLSELVKIDPKSIGVGQYQHDVDQKALKKSLDDVVASCVNAVGVAVNTASKQLLSYISGLSPRLAANFVAHRNAHGKFNSRQDLMKVAGMGPKTFEQAAGFLRIDGAANPLDASAVHPESYPVVERMARDMNCSVSDLIQDAKRRGKINLEQYVTETVGIPTLTDIIDELAKPGRDPREPFDLFTFTEGINAITDLRVGMKLAGVVTNVTAFGAFVDIGIHRDGLVHISELSDRYVRDPHEVVNVHQQVTVTVIGIEIERERISLSMR
ncbi:RNA-binding transcriptional accessory protein [Candidatus Poribacteria bacterium]|nr:RNA-binding transcriptional accessory protein [Candidatus Poribacteria bacterium]